MGADLLASFDCRIGSFASFNEAFSLILWRSYDSGINGVSDKIHQLKDQTTVKEILEKTGSKLTPDEFGKERNAAFAAGAAQKMEFLFKFNLLPIPEHQACGSFFCQHQVWHRGMNPKTGEIMPATMKKELVKVPLFPQKDSTIGNAAAEVKATGSGNGITEDSIAHEKFLGGVLGLFAREQLFPESERLEDSGTE